MGERVRSYRISNSYTQADFAEKIDISINFLSEIENGKKGMSQETLYKLCEHFGLSADYILFGREAAAGASGPDGNLDNTELKTLTDFLVSMRGIFSSGPVSGLPLLSEDLEGGGSSR